jgi:hypothetical protein
MIFALSKVFESKHFDSVNSDNSLIEVKLNLTGIEVILLSVYRL